MIFFLGYGLNIKWFTVISKPFLIIILNAIYISPEKPKERNLCLKKSIYFQ
jgi:hypothetical protein